MKGSYILLVKLPEEQVIPTGGLHDVHFRDGYYAYVGSAMNGIESRLRHHLRGNKKPHWHIDYLLQRASIVDIGICETGDRAECKIARELESQFDSIPAFGSSDCCCKSHLFFAAEERQMKEVIRATLGLLAIPPKLIGLGSY